MRPRHQYGFILGVIIAVVAVVIIGATIYCIASDNCGGGGGGTATASDCNSEWRRCNESCSSLPSDQIPGCRQDCDANSTFCQAGTGSTSQGLTPAEQTCRTTWKTCVSRCAGTGKQKPVAGKNTALKATNPLDPKSLEYDQCEAGCAAERSLCDPCLTAKLVCQSKAAICLLGCPSGDVACADSCKSWYPICLNPGRLKEMEKDIAARIEEKLRGQLIGDQLGPQGKPPLGGTR